MEAKGRLVTTDPERVPELMDWYDSQLRQILNDFGPEKISYRFLLNANKEQCITSIFPLGLLNFLAHQNGLSIASYTPQSFVASKLGIPKGSDVYAHCDKVFGRNPPHWDKAQKNSLLAAWFELAKK